MTRILALIAGLLMLAPSAHAQSAALRGILEDYAAYTRAADPIRAGQRDDREALRRWPDDRPEAVAKRRLLLQDLQRRLAGLQEPLTPEDRLNRELLARRIGGSLEGFRFDEERIPFLSGEGFYTLPEITASTTAVRDERDIEAWIARLEALPAYFDAQLANMRRGVATGFTQPEMTTRTAIEVLRGLAAEPAEKSALLAPLSAMPASIPEARRTALRARAVGVIRDRVRPAQAAAAAFLEREYLPAARRGLGVGTLPGGRDYYAYLARRHTTTDLTPEAIHATGEREIARIRAEMTALVAETGFKGDLPAFIAHLRSAPQFYAADNQDLMEKTTEILKRADYALPKWFGKLPRLPYGVLPKPQGLESISTGYNPGSPETGVAGAVILSMSGPRNMPLYGLPAWALHEGVPGHHLQIALAQERADLPEFRRNDDLTAYVEGWALYAERLGEEMGLYRDPYERFGRLSLEMWRACRLVMDTGIHVMGWSYDRAAACLRENTALSTKDIEAETKRYVGWPGQALAYKVGELEIVRLRAAEEAALGDRFDVRAFHDAVLAEGPMPLALLARRMEETRAARAGRP